jgi:hypothetical protein
MAASGIDSVRFESSFTDKAHKHVRQHIFVNTHVAAPKPPGGDALDGVSRLWVLLKVGQNGFANGFSIALSGIWRHI